MHISEAQMMFSHTETRWPENPGTARIRSIAQREHKQAKSGQQACLWLIYKGQMGSESGGMKVGRNGHGGTIAFSSQPQSLQATHRGTIIVNVYCQLRAT